MTRRLKRAVFVAVFCAQVVGTRADTPPFVESAVLGCEDAFQLDVTFDELVDPVSAMDAFNYTVFQSVTNGAPHLRGDGVADVSHDGISFRVFLEHGAFVPDTKSVLRVDYVTDLAGNPVFPVLTAVTPCPEPRLSIARMNGESFQIAWATNYAGFSLESATGLATAGWQLVTNSISIEGDRFTIRLAVTLEPRFYRLRKP